jgi:capsule polysaccharide export protein KpsC/LpsZ
MLTRPNSFYKSLKKLPNLILVDSTYNKLQLIKKSKGIITICGTIGYEAWLLGKKVLTLGNMFYNSFPDIFSVKNYDQFNFYLTDLLNNQDITTSEEERFRIDNYIKNNCTVEGSIFSYETKFNKMSDEEKIINMRNLRDYILNDLNKK